MISERNKLMSHYKIKAAYSVQLNRILHQLLALVFQGPAVYDLQECEGYNGQMVRDEPEGLMVKTVRRTWSPAAPAVRL